MNEATLSAILSAHEQTAKSHLDCVTMLRRFYSIAPAEQQPGILVQIKERAAQLEAVAHQIRDIADAPLRAATDRALWEKEQIITTEAGS